MSYLKLHRSRILLASFLAASLLLGALPSIDIQISRWIVDTSPGSLVRFWEKVFHRGMGYLLGASMAVVGALYVFNKRARKRYFDVDGRKVLVLFLALVVGVGLIVNVILKDHFGRARPRDIQEFGGSKQFTPAFVLSRECDKNCSFSSGEAAAGFYALSLAMVLSRRRFYIVAACAFGCLASYFRVAAGAHFFSDVVVSFFVMLLVTDVLRHYLMEPPPNDASRLLQKAGPLVPVMTKVA
jgi:lipid A 4'-phosphatase